MAVREGKKTGFKGTTGLLRAESARGVINTGQVSKKQPQADTGLIQFTGKGGGLKRLIIAAFVAVVVLIGCANQQVKKCRYQTDPLKKMVCVKVFYGMPEFAVVDSRPLAATDLRCWPCEVFLESVDLILEADLE